MQRPKPATPDELVSFLAGNSSWAEETGRLLRSYRFRDFREAMAFMTRVAEHAERLDHHPNWSNVYNRVEVQLLTHDVQAITVLDFELARCMDGEARTLAG